jgi:hypothetical protein
LLVVLIVILGSITAVVGIVVSKAMPLPHLHVGNQAITEGYSLFAAKALHSGQVGQPGNELSAILL